MRRAYTQMHTFAFTNVAVISNFTVTAIIVISFARHAFAFLSNAFENNIYYLEKNRFHCNLQMRFEMP